MPKSTAPKKSKTPKLCPSCGSIQIVSRTPGIFVCKHCHTEFPG